MITPTIAAFAFTDWTAAGAWLWLANHLWQSTLFAVVAGLLTLTLRKNRAQVRYWLWLTASLKFLIPFSLLISIGSHLSPPKASAQTEAGFSTVVQEIGQPFAAAKPVASLPAAKSAGLMPILLLVLWSGGCAGVLLFWSWRWRRVIAVRRQAVPLDSGREFEAQRRLERDGRIAAKVGIVASGSTLEPGVIGIFSPLLVLPAGIADRLTDAQLEAIIAHELCHVRRGDNLAALIQMLVEAIFWFHPLVWWIGARLVDERERACDEDVLRLGGEPQAYAEGILRVCEFYLESPLVCVAGVTGSNLKRRIEDIMSNRITRKLDLARKLLLTTMGVAAVVTPIVVGLLSPTASRAQEQTVVSVRPAPSGFIIPQPGSSEWKMSGATLSQLIERAYNLKAPQIIGPAWFTTNQYDIAGRAESGSSPLQLNLQAQKQLQAMLADRFKLKFHRETRNIPVFELVVAKNGLKIREVALDKTKTWGLFRVDRNGHMTGAQVDMQQLANPFLSDLTGQLVMDKTGLNGVYDVAFDWTWGDNQSILTALQEQLGLELKPQTSSAEVLVVDHVEEPGIVRTSVPGNNVGAPAFATVSIKPIDSDHAGWWSHSYPDGRFVARNASLKALIQTAYGITVVSIPDALTSQRYDIDASAGGPAEEDRIKLMLRTLLSTRFKLASHTITEEMPVYMLAVGTQGPRLRLVDPTSDKCELTIKAPGDEAHIVGKGTVSCLAGILNYLSQADPPSVDRPVLDNSRLRGVFDLDVPIYLREPSSLFATVQQLGLKLEPSKAPIQQLIVDHAEPVAE